MGIAIWGDCRFSTDGVNAYDGICAGCSRTTSLTLGRPPILPFSRLAVAFFGELILPNNPGTRPKPHLQISQMPTCSRKTAMSHDPSFGSSMPISIFRVSPTKEFKRHVVSMYPLCPIAYLKVYSQNPSSFWFFLGIGPRKQFLSVLILAQPRKLK